MLTVAAIERMKPRSTVYRVADTDGLCIEITPNGSRLWRYRYRFAGKARMMALGSYPQVPLAGRKDPASGTWIKGARELREDARQLVQQGIDPVAVRREQREELAREEDHADRFAAVAREWLEHRKPGWAAETYRKAHYACETYLIPPLQDAPIATLATKNVLPVLGDLAEKAPNLAIKARQYLGGIVQRAIQRGLREDGRFLSLKGAVRSYEKGHIPAATRPQDIAPLLSAIEVYPSPVVRAALILAMLTVMRPGVIAAARWADFDLDAAEWHVPGHMMKTRHAHIVSLPRQALAILEDMQAFSGGREYVFPPLARQTSKHLSRDTLSAALRRMGFQGQHATHGFRGMLRTVGRERLGFDIDVLEAQLAHAKKGDVQKAYDRTTFTTQRRDAMQAWADYLDGLRTAANVVPLAAARCRG